MPTIKDLAKFTGLSVGTVSRAFNERYTDISAETRVNVLRAAREIGYSPNKSAQNLASKSLKNIALLSVRDDKGSYIDEILLRIMTGAFSYTSEFGIEMATYMLDGLFRKKKTYDRFCVEHSVSGLLLFGIGLDDPHIKCLVNHPHICVTVDVEADGERVGNVLTDDVTAFDEATMFLIDNNHKNIVLLMGHPGATVTGARWKGAQNALKRNNLPLPVHRILGCDFKTEEAYRKVTAFLKMYGKTEATAFLCMSDSMAVGTIRAIQDCGYNVPDDFSVMGYDGLTVSELTTPKITTTDQNFIQKGYMAVKLLRGLLEDSSEPHKIYVPHSLIVRDSVRRI